MVRERERKDEEEMGGREQGVRVGWRGELVEREERRLRLRGWRWNTIEMEGRKQGNCGAKQTERRERESAGCDGERRGKEEKESKGFMRGSRECLFQWSQKVQMAS